MSSRVSITLKGVVLVSALTGSLVFGFKPDEETFGHTKITRDILKSGFSFSTAPAVAKFDTALVKDSKIIAFSDEATRQVIEGVQSTDWIFNHDRTFEGVEVSIIGEISTETAHCDNELIVNCSGRIIDKKRQVVRLATAYVDSKDKKQLVQARIELGKALHTLQDFYAHSNWTDNHTSADFYAKLSTGNVSADVLKASVSACEERSWIRDIEPSWYSNGGNYKFTTGGKDATKITSGFFDNLKSVANMGSAPDGPASKCDHGVEILNNTISGINKDAPYSPLTPAPQSTTLWDRLVNLLTPFEQNSGESELHVRASYHAALHTRQLLTEVVADIRSANTSNTDRADAIVSALLGIEQTPLTGFVIDTTGSMSDIITGVQTQVQKLIDTAVSSSASTTSQFLLVAYGDPDVGSAFTGNAAEVKARVASLRASGGGDCPELTQGGILAALAAAPDHSVLYVFTDASSKDATRAGEVQSAALAKSITINYVASGSCSPIDPSYYQIAAATGGLVLVTEHNSASVAAAFTGISIESEGKSLLPARIETASISADRSVTIPVESGASRLSIQVTSDDANVDFLDPNGAPVVVSSSVVVTSFLGGKSIKVTNPAAGNWTAQLKTTTTTSYTLRADVASALSIAQAGFFKHTAEGRPGHEAHVGFSGPPPQTQVRLQALVTGAPKTVAFDLVGADGSVLAHADTSKLTDSAYAGMVTIPATPFRIKLSGTDSVDKAFERVSPTLYTSTTMVIDALDSPIWVRGTDNTVRVRVTNYGATRDVTLSAAPAGVQLKSISPITQTIAAGGSALFDASFTLAADAPANVEGQLNFSATTGTDNAKLTVHFSPALDTDGDGVPDMMEQGPSNADLAYDGNGDGTPDWKQANVASLYSRSSNTYVTLAVDSPLSLAFAHAVPVPDAQAASLPAGGFMLNIKSVTSDGTARLNVILPDYVTAEGFYTAASGGTWSDLGKVLTGTVSVTGHVLSVQLSDGKDGDSDGRTDGSILLAGGPSGVAMANVRPQSAATPDTSASDSGGGGCTIGDPRRPDMSLLLLTATAAGMLLRRSRRAAHAVIPKPGA